MIKIKHTVSIVFICLLCFCAIHTVPVYSEEMPTVRAGLYNAQRYSYRNDDGSYAGADIEYAYRIAQKAGFKIEITLFNNETDMLRSLNEGTTDMLFDFGKTDDIKNKYLFSESKIGASALSVYARTTDYRFVYGDIEQLKDKVFGYEKGNHVAGAFSEWCKEHGFTPKLKSFDSIKTVDTALSDKKIDAGIVGENGRKGYTTILTFSPRAYYIIFKKNSTSLKVKVDAAMNKILAYDPFFEEKLLRKYGITKLGVTGFTAEEKKFIAWNSEIRVAVIRNDEPYYSQDRTGKCEGIIPSYYKKVSEYLGMTFSFHPYDSTPDAIEAMKSGKVDIIAMFSDGIIVAEQKGILLTDAYENVDSVLLMRPGITYEEIKKIAVKHRSINIARQGILALINSEVVPVNNAKEEFALLREGKVDAIVCGQPTSTWLLNQTNSSAYTTMVLSSQQFDLCAAVAPDKPTLLSIMDKAISATNYGFELIVENNTRPGHTLQALISRIPAMAIIIFALFTVLMITVLVVAILFLLKSRRTKLAAAAEQAAAAKQRIEAEAIEKNAEEKNTFFSNISHDMRTPLNAIIGFTRLAQRDDIESETKTEYLKKAEMSGMLLLDLINDTLTISKVNSGKMELRLEPCKASDVINTVTSSIKESAAKKKIEFVSDVSEMTEVYIAADKLNVEKIFLNLLANAVKYTPEGGHVWYKAVKETESDAHVSFLFTIKDDGIGISSEFLPHIYEPFSQEKRTGYESMGTGLGLSIVKQLVNLMGGTIEVQSEKNKGTTFTVHLSFIKVNPVSNKRKIPEIQGKESLAGKKVLLCEDNQMNREIAEALLHDAGVETVCAENGEIGVEKFQESKIGEYYAILMDLRMPVKNGYEATEAIRCLDRDDAKTIPVIAMTADAFETDVQKCIDAGMNGHVAKPIDPQQLFKVLAGQTDAEM